VVLALALTTFAGFPLDAQDSGATKHPMEIRYNIPVRMRDGVKISVDVFRPKDGTEHPAMLLQTP